jgi:carbonic anhydrase
MPIPELMAGWQRFRAGRYKEQQRLFERIAREGQQPRIAMVACCDSRVEPAILFDCDPGELFVVRNVANLVPPYSPDGAYHGVSAALEFAVAALKVKHIVVLGHAHCGGVRAYAEDAEPLSPGDFIGKWMSLMAPAAEKVGARGALSRPEYLQRMEQASVVNSLDNLMTFPRLRKLIERGQVQLHGAYFGVATGQLSVLDLKTRAFSAVGAES